MGEDGFGSSMKNTRVDGDSSDWKKKKSELGNGLDSFK